MVVTPPAAAERVDQAKPSCPAWLRLCLGGTADEAATRLQGIQAFLDAGTAAEQQFKRRHRLRSLGIRGLVAAVVVVSVAAAVVGLTLQSQARSRELAAQQAWSREYAARLRARQAELKLAARDAPPSPPAKAAPSEPAPETPTP